MPCEPCPACLVKPGIGSVAFLPAELRERHRLPAKPDPGARHVAWVVCGCGGRPWWTKLKAVPQPRPRDLSEAWNDTLRTQPPRHEQSAHTRGKLWQRARRR